MTDGGWIKNLGTCPGRLKGTAKKVYVRFRNGLERGPYPADGRGAVIWSQYGDFPYDIMEWKDAE